MNEIYKPIKNYEQNYEVSNFGNIRNRKTKQILLGDINTAGYRRVILYLPIKKRYFIHRLVAMHFVSGYKEGLVVNHIDGNKTNNRADNLEWVTRSENDLHTFKNKLRQFQNQKYPHGCIWQTFDLTSGSTIKTYYKLTDFLKDYHFSERTSTYYMFVHGWIYKDRKNRKLGKIGVRRIFK